MNLNRPLQIQRQRQIQRQLRPPKKSTRPLQIQRQRRIQRQLRPPKKAGGRYRFKDNAKFKGNYARLKKAGGRYKFEDNVKFKGNGAQVWLAATWLEIFRRCCSGHGMPCPYGCAGLRRAPPAEITSSNVVHLPGELWPEESFRLDCRRRQRSGFRRSSAPGCLARFSRGHRLRSI